MSGAPAGHGGSGGGGAADEAAEAGGAGGKRRRGGAVDAAKMPLRGVLASCTTGRPMKAKEPDRTRRRTESERGAEESVREVGAEAPAPAVIAPKVQLVGGRLVVDAASLVVVPVVAPATAEFDTVHESHSHVTSSSYGRRQHSERWSKEETNAFFDALKCYGTDFSLFERLFPGRPRRQLKNKFKREERENPARVDEALSAATRRMDPSQFQALAARAAARADKDKEREREKEKEGAEKAKESAASEADKANDDDELEAEVEAAEAAGGRGEAVAKGKAKDGEAKKVKRVTIAVSDDEELVHEGRAGHSDGDDAGDDIGEDD